MYVPKGVNLAQNTASPLLGLLTYPISLLASPLVSANLLLVLAMPVSATAGFYVLRHWNVWGPAAALGGAIYGFSPYMVGQGLGHFQLIFIPVPPFIALTLEAILHRRGNPRWLGVQLGALVVVQYLISPEVMADVALLAIAALICIVVRNPAAWRTMAPRRPGADDHRHRGGGRRARLPLLDAAGGSPALRRADPTVFKPVSQRPAELCDPRPVGAGVIRPAVPLGWRAEHQSICPNRGRRVYRDPTAPRNRRARLALTASGPDAADDCPFGSLGCALAGAEPLRGWQGDPHPVAVRGFQALAGGERHPPKPVLVRQPAAFLAAAIAFGLDDWHLHRHRAQRGPGLGGPRS